MNISIAQTKIGYIDFDSTSLYLPDLIKDQHPNYNTLNKHLELTIVKLTDSLSTLQNQYYDFISRQSCKISEDKRKENAIMFTTLENNIDEFYKIATAKIEKHKLEIQEVLLDITIQKLKRFSQEHKINVIADKKSILYCPNCTDYTNAFMDYLKQEYTMKKAPHSPY